MNIQFRIHIIIILFITTVASCQKNKNSNLMMIDHMPKKLEEVSGITMAPTKETIYAINDSGNDETVFELNSQGKIIATYTIPNATNVDWEDLTYDASGNLYIGDFGNNYNDRKDLAIYKVSGITDGIPITNKITFILEDQQEFPPSKKNRNYDIEAFIYHNGSFFLFSKNRSSKFDGTTKLYKVNAQPGQQVAKLIDTFKTCEDAKDCFITAASINTHGDKIALLTYNKIYILENFNGDHLFNSHITKLKLDHYSQKEGICFKNDTTLYIVDEKRDKRKGRLYEFNLN